MKKVMIVAFGFPPSQGIGAQRPYKLAKYFNNYGWEPVILTIKLPGERPDKIKIIESEYTDIIDSFKSLLKFKKNKSPQTLQQESVSKISYSSIQLEKFKHFLYKTVIFQEKGISWYRNALKSATEFLDKETVDAVISTFPPGVTHVIARKIKRKYKVPWIADMRDLWSQDPYFNRLWITKNLLERWEVKIMSDADALVTVTAPWIDTLKSIHKNKRIHVITNGFDDDDFWPLPSKLTDKFTMTYTGQLYHGKRDPSMLFKAVSQLISEHKIDRDIIEIRFYVPKEHWIDEMVKLYKLEDIVHIQDYVPRNEALIRQKESQLLLILRWDNKGEEGFCPGKIYEYFGARRPVIIIGGPFGIVTEMLDKANAGKYARSSDELKKYIAEYYDEFIKNGDVKCRSNDRINDYKYDFIAKQYSDILNHVVSERVTG